MTDSGKREFVNDPNAKTQVINNKRVREEINNLEETKKFNSDDINKILKEEKERIAQKIETTSFDSKEESQLSIDEEIEKSIKRLVAEETSVARAYIDSDDKVFDFKQELEDYKDTVVSSKLNEKNKKKKLDKKTKYTIIAIVSTVLILAAVIVTVLLVNLSSRKKSYAYNYEQGMNYYKEDNYPQAEKYLRKASLTQKGKEDLDLKFTLYECYYKQDKYDESIECLKDILSYDKNHVKALKALAENYYKHEDGQALTELINDYKDNNLYSYLEKYVVDAPVASKEPGAYDDDLEISLKASSDTTIYYTIDGSTPSNKSAIYTGLAIKLTTGTTVIKAVAIDKIGVVSDVFEGEYVLSYGKPAPPEISPASGSYSKGQVFAITNVPEDAKAYYTLDGSTPTSSSTLYTDEVELPVGNVVVSAVIVSSHNQTSSVTKRNYIVTDTSSYSKEMCMAYLQEHLINTNVLKDANTLASGTAAEISYIETTTINNSQIYVYKLMDKTNSKLIANYGVSIDSAKIYILTGSSGSYIANPA